MSWKSLLAGITIFSIATAHGAVEIVKNGKSAYAIVVARKPLPITSRAASVLQAYIQKATSVKIPIVKRGVLNEKPSIVVGDCEAARKAGINVKKIKPEGFVIKTIGNNLYIVGRDTAGGGNSDHWRTAPQSGTWYGVARFLEQFLDIRAFFPSKFGESVPKRLNLVVGSIDISDYPKMDYRRMSYLWWKGLSKKRIKEVKDWKRINGNGWSVVWQASHSWLYNFRGEDYFKAHPEWFALVNGQRLAYSPHGLQMCTTNPQALDQFAKTIIEKSQKSNGTMFSLSPNDGGGHCECAKCRALDVEKNPDGTPVLTDRYVTYCNEVAKRVNKVLPNQTFGFYAYSFYSNPPRKTKLDPHVKVMHVNNGVAFTYYSKEYADKYLNEKLLPWKKAVGTLYFYTHPNGMGTITLPSMHPKAIKRLYADLAKAGVTGVSLNMAEPFDSTGIDYYLYLKMAWDPGADFDAIYADAMQKCYGEAAPMVQKYFDSLADAVVAHSKNLKADVSMGSLRKFPTVLETIYDGLYEKGMPYLEKASKTGISENQRWRLNLLIENLKYCKDTVDLYKLSKKILRNSKPNQQEVLAALALARKRVAYFAELAKMGLLSMARMKEQEKNFNLPFSPQIYISILKQIKGGVRKAYTAKIEEKDSVIIDGKLDDDIWKKLKPMKIRADKNSGDDIGPGATFKIAYDDANLYIGVTCAEPLMSEIKDGCVKHDGKVWNENEIEIFFDQENSQKNFRQICVNTLGTIADIESIAGKGDLKWSSDAKTAVFKEKSKWIMEIRVPFAKLANTPPEPGDIWGFNICRVRRTVEQNQYTCWNPTFGGFLKPARFGKLIFK